MCLSLYDYQSKSSRYRQGYLKTRATTNQKHKIDSPKPKRRELKHKMKRNHHTTKKKKKKRGTTEKESTVEKGLKWQQIYIYVYQYMYQEPTIYCLQDTTLGQRTHID